MKADTISLLRHSTFCLFGLCCFLTCAISAHEARADDQFNANGGMTGTQGVVGNPDCAPPTVIENGKKITPLNWSCDSSGYWPSVAPHVTAPQGAPHPGPAYAPGAANPCLPFGPGGYNWLANPVGTRLPPGCRRREQDQPVTINGSNGPTDAHREILPHKLQIAAPTPPGEGIPDIYRQVPVPIGGDPVDPEPPLRSPTLPLGQLAPGQ